MKSTLFLLKIFIIFFFFISDGLTVKAKFFDEGKKLFDKNKFEKSKFFFEKDIVFNPKSENSYLYLAKIFKKNEKWAPTYI